MADYGIKIAVPGVNVLTAGLGDLLFHTKYPLLKIKAEGSGTVQFYDGGAGFNIQLHAHNLGYKPLYIVFSQYYDSLSNTLISTYDRMPYVVRNSSFSQAFSYTPVNSTTELRYSGGSFGGDSGLKTINYLWRVYYEPE